MRRQSSKTRLWTILVISNFVAMMYPIRLCAQAEDIEAQIFAGAVLLIVLMVMLVSDAVSVLVAYMQ